MTLDTAHATAASVEHPIRDQHSPSRPRLWPRLRWWAELLTLLTLLGFLLFDRIRLLQLYLTRYTDEDQAIEWLAAKDILHGHFHEPCFFGQAYNSNLEGYLGAPLVALHIPPWIALPIVTVLLSLFPFVLLSWLAWHRCQRAIAALCLALPILFCTDYGVMTGMPRGFVTGLAFAVLSAALFLPPLGKSAVLIKNRFRRSHPKRRYFAAAFFAVIAVTLNPNAAVLLAPVAIYALLTTFREWRFWVFTAFGLLAAGPYPAFVYEFYYVWHDDYRMHQRKVVWTWSWANWDTYLNKLADNSFRYFFPESLSPYAGTLFQWLHKRFPDPFFAWGFHAPAAMAVLFAFALAVIILLLRLRISAVLAACAGAAVVIVSFACSRIHDGGDGPTLPLARMFLPVPVLWLWLLMLLPRATRPTDRSRGWRWWQWTRTRLWPNVAFAAAIGITLWAATIALQKAAALPGQIKRISSSGGVSAWPITRILQMGDQMQSAATRTGATLILVGNSDRVWAYTLPVLTTVGTLYPDYERRTWLLHEECFPRHDKILVMGGVDESKSKDLSPTDVFKDPPVTLWHMNGKSVIAFCRQFGLHIREFQEPPLPQKK